jgi:hypothetical protein
MCVRTSDHPWLQNSEVHVADDIVNVLQDALYVNNKIKNSRSRSWSTLVTSLGLAAAAVDDRPWSSHKTIHRESDAGAEKSRPDATKLKCCLQVWRVRMFWWAWTFPYYFVFVKSTLVVLQYGEEEHEHRARTSYAKARAETVGLFCFVTIVQQTCACPRWHQTK